VRLKRLQDDYRVFEQLDESGLGKGPYGIHRVTKKGLTSAEAAAILAKAAGVEVESISYAGFKDRDGVSGQYMSVEGGKPVEYKDGQVTIRSIGRSETPLTSENIQGNSFELVLRDLRGHEMARIRHNLAQAKTWGMPNYFDDQRFGCLRHGQGFVMRQLLRGDVEGAIKSLLCAPSPYGAEKVEQYKAGIMRRWGDWQELSSFCRGRRGASLFQYLVENPEDFKGALERGISTRERTIHLFSYQSHLWNRVAAMWIRGVIGDDENLGWLPCDDGPLPVFRQLEKEQLEMLSQESIPLYGVGVEVDGLVERYYRTVFKSEKVDPEAFLGMDISGFRPMVENRPLLMLPEYLRAAPAERDDVYRKTQKMRLRFTLANGQYSTLVAKRLAMPTERGEEPPMFWISRHRLTFPDDNGRMDAPDQVSYDERDRDTGYRGKRKDYKDQKPQRNSDRGGYRRDNRNGSNRGGYRGKASGGGNRGKASGGGNRGKAPGGGYKTKPKFEKESNTKPSPSPWDNRPSRKKLEEGKSSEES
jgi:tRNA pseudouridine13 synthase